MFSHTFDSKTLNRPSHFAQSKYRHSKSSTSLFGALLLRNRPVMLVLRSQSPTNFGMMWLRHSGPVVPHREQGPFDGQRLFLSTA